MSKKQHYLDLLIHVYEYEETLLVNKSESELAQLVETEQKKSIKTQKNPNAFFVLKDLPTPEYVEPKTSKKGGILVVVAFALTFILFGAIMFWWAFS